jgi:hypothetical protein
LLSGETISFYECIERIKSGRESQDDTLQIGLGLEIDLDEISRTFNHSCDPNAGLRKVSEMIALRDIAVGEEITFDYSATVGPDVPGRLWTMQCKCGSMNCRKIVGNILSIPPEQLKKYADAGALQDYILVEFDKIRKNGGVLPTYPQYSLS